MSEFASIDSLEKLLNIAREAVLPSSEIKQIDEVEEKSLATFCDKFGFNTDWYKRQWLTRTQQIIRERKSSISQQLAGFANPSDELMLHSIGRGDYWATFRTLSWMNHKTRCLSIAENGHSLNSLNREYLNSLGVARGVSTALSRPRFLFETLLRVPEVNYFDTIYGSYVRPSSFVFSGMPYVACYPHLQSTTDVIAESVLNLVFESTREHGLRLKAPAEIDDIRNDTTIKKILALALHAVLGRSPSFWTARFKGTPQSIAAVHQPIAYYFVKCACNYVVDYHEVAHLLLGHPLHGPSVKAEIDADNLALDIIEKEYSILENMMDAGVIGIAIAMAFLASAEGVTQDSEAQDYPIAKRLEACVSRYEGAYRFRDLIESIRYGIAPSIEFYRRIKHQSTTAWKAMFQEVTNEAA